MELIKKIQYLQHTS